MSYSAVVARIHTRPLPGSDNIVLGTCLGYQVIVNKETEDGALGIFFEQGGQLSPEFAEKHDLVRRKDEYGNKAGGFFEENRRVKALKLRSAISEGFWCPISHVEYTDADPEILVEGYTFCELNGHQICNKYETPQTKAARAAAGKSGRVRKDNPMFPKHIETAQFKAEGALIPAGAVIYISEKQHGTSHRLGLVLDEVAIPRSWLGRKLAKLLRRPTTRKEWAVLNGTRNTVLATPDTVEYHGSAAWRFNAVGNIALHKGEVIYGELVGYTPTAPIMATQSTTALKDKRITKKFGDEITYSYGMEPGQCKFVVYRIVHMNEDGRPTELSWPQVVQRCHELGLETVKTLDTFIYDGDLDALTTRVLDLIEAEDGMPSTIDPSHPMEGVVLRCESEFGIRWMKAKSRLFGILEGYLKESDTYVDLEEAS